MADRRVVNRGDSFDDSTAKNSWKWTWLETWVGEEELLSDHIRKMNAVGTAFCELYLCNIVYNLRGSVALEDYMKTETIVSVAAHER